MSANIERQTILRGSNQFPARLRSLAADFLVYRLLFESSAELIRRIDKPNRLATDSVE
jgi:hypothetical protein